MALQNTSLLPELLSQLDKPEEWYDYTYSNPTVNNGVIPLYAQYEKGYKNKSSKVHVTILSYRLLYHNQVSIKIFGH